MFTEHLQMLCVGHNHSCPTAVVLQLSHMTLCFSDVMRRHHSAQTAFREKCKAQIRRQLHIGESDIRLQRHGRQIHKLASVHLLVSKETTDKELEQMLDRDRLAVFVSHVSTDDITAASVMSSAANLSMWPPRR